ncbi:hypothetical protein SAMN05444280_12660 [Tangfeifania diversioriginum]|uniref:Uncharacterized protein n=1 Tax=Tangfeifania diversioriginum TaxID=1168035 RepID=A0A1M6LDJ6_9BACT|nr:hypothetical protein [Tangfeifania diversioriginum]SHJ69248.1 hypothetical protein SAMN05444280_12660 [Tangfeifania diversioriginum]
MNKIDINFDFRQDSKCGDPDTDSHKLYYAHTLLWNKVLPCGKIYDVEITSNKYGRLLIKNNLGDNLSSDRMCPHFDGKYKGKFDGCLSDMEREELKYKVRTIGGHIIFPAHNKNGFTVNQARGISRLICDRFDLTLECIRRFYNEEKSPLYDALLRYNDFFDLFVDFTGYVDFFMLQDFIDDEEQINFSIPFDNFTRPPLPQTVCEYKKYTTHTIDLINRRNKRILESLYKIEDINISVCNK